MTAILAFIENGNVYVGADSQVTAGYDIWNDDYDKIHINGDIVAAFSGTHTVLPLAEKLFKSLDPHKIINLKDDIWDYFLVHMQRETNIRNMNNETYSAIFAKGDQLIDTTNKGCITSYKKCTAIGVGGPAARTAYHVLERYRADMRPLELLKNSLTTAADLNSCCNKVLKYATTKDLKVLSLV